LPSGAGFSREVLEDRPGILVLRFAGEAENQLLAEGGGHRWQRIPKNDKQARVHTSTVTVAVLPEPSDAEVRIDPRDIEWTACRGSGAGGQARNKTSNAVQVWHKPSGMTIRVESERSQSQNRASAMGLLRARLRDAGQQQRNLDRDLDRKQQVGGGARGDKIRTYRVRDDQVHDHRTDKKVSLRLVQRGNLHLLA
jgi:peptide chain release factor 1